MIEQQAVFAAARQNVQRKSDAPQEMFAILKSLQLAGVRNLWSTSSASVAAPK